MDLLINVLLVTSGFVGAGVAIGGRTWLENQDHLLARITNRGWIAIVCLVTTFVLGVVKES